MHALVEDLEIVLVGIAVADAVEHAEQRLVAAGGTPGSARSARCRRLRAAPAPRRRTGRRCSVSRCSADLRLLHHRRQLMQIAEHDEPHAAERLARAAAVDAQRLVDGPHQVGAHHRHLVDDEEFELAHDAAVAAAADVVGADQPRRQAEERMDGLAADVDGGKPRRRDDDHFVGDQVPEAAQQRRFAGAGAAGDEQVALALAQVFVARREILGRRLDAGGPAAGGQGGWRIVWQRRHEVRLRSGRCVGSLPVAYSESAGTSCCLRLRRFRDPERREPP